VPIERSYRLVINRLQRSALELQPDTEVRDHAKMEPRYVVAVPAPHELLFVVSKEFHKHRRSDG
jgi:hypothetical protein